MPEIRINNKVLVTQTGAAEPVLASNVNLGSATFPAGHILNVWSKTKTSVDSHTSSAWKEITALTHTIANPNSGSNFLLSGHINGAWEVSVTKIGIRLTRTDSNGEVQGHEFTTRITFPTIYPRGKESYDITSNVTIHRVKLSTSAIGVYNLEIKRKGYDTYNILVEQTPADDFYASSPPEIAPGISITVPPLRGEYIETVPIYTRNKNLTLTMYTNYDAPLTLNSMTWEGDWNPPYYKRV